MDSVRGEYPAGTLLVVEDDVDVAAALTEILQDHGFRVARAFDGRDGLELLRGGFQADAILLDLMMPVMDGWQFRLEQRRDPSLAAVPIIALSADNSARARAVDADAFLEKPVDAQVLLRTVSDLVIAARARRQESERLAHTERLTTLGQLAAGVAHEVNNPLSWVIGNLKIISDRLANPDKLLSRLEDTRAAAREALEGAMRIQEIVSDIRVFTRRVDDEVTSVDLVEAVDGVLRLLHQQLEGRVRVIRDFERPPRVHASPGRLRQVLLNLVVNAIDALPEDGVGRNELRIRLAPEEGRVRVEVRDNGSGIPPAILPRIFEPFFSTKPPGRGTGLGLFVCRGLVTAMGSELSVSSELGQGARFWFSLPTAEAAIADLPRRPRAPLRSQTILAIDDEAEIRAMLSRVLQPHRVVAMASAEEALDFLGAGAGENVDVILSDLYMPGLGGRGLFYELVRRGTGLETRMLFMTGGILDDETLQFAKSRSDRVLQKPIELAELEEAISVMGDPSRRARAV